MAAPRRPARAWLAALRPAAVVFSCGPRQLVRAPGACRPATHRGRRGPGVQDRPGRGDSDGRVRRPADRRDDVGTAVEQEGEVRRDGRIRHFPPLHPLPDGLQCRPATARRGRQRPSSRARRSSSPKRARNLRFAARSARSGFDARPCARPGPPRRGGRRSPPPRGRRPPRRPASAPRSAAARPAVPRLPPAPCRAPRTASASRSPPWRPCARVRVRRRAPAARRARRRAGPTARRERPSPGP